MVVAHSKPHPVPRASASLFAPFFDRFPICFRFVSWFSDAVAFLSLAQIVLCEYWILLGEASCDGLRPCRHATLKNIVTFFLCSHVFREKERRLKEGGSFFYAIRGTLLFTFS